jgi:hypothetical protein
MPSAGAEALLFGAKRAVIALEEMQRGFFLQRQSKVPSIRYVDSDGMRRDLSIVDAVSQYLKVLRNSTHGYGDKVASRAGKTNALLASHNGEIPDDLPLLGYLYLLKIMLETDALKRKLHFGGII